MRHWLLVLLIVLLPVRGWAGDAMAFSMGDAPGSHPVAAACHDAAAPSAGDLTHPDTRHHAPATDAAAQDHGAGDHSTCTACDICHGPAMALTAHSHRSSPPLHARTAPVSERFASALPQRGSKPPIA